MRVAVDMISAGSGFAPAAGGMLSYYDGLLQALCQRPDVESVVVFVSPWNQGLGVPRHSSVEVVACRGLPRRRVGRVLYEQLVLPLLLRRAHPDVVLFTCNVKPLASRLPSAVVLQSLQYFLLGQNVGPLRGAYLRSLVPRSLRSTDLVIAVTETERSDAIRLFGLSPDRVTVVYHGMSNWARHVLERGEESAPFTLPDSRPYVLTVSRLYEFKNHQRLIRAFAQVTAQEAIDHSLVIVGGEADLTRAQLEAIGDRAGLGGRLHYLGPVSQDRIPGLFKGAAAVAYVSLYETFGHPVLEAFAFGKPLVTSATGATAEVAGGAARLVDPYDVGSIAEGLRDVLLNDGLQTRLEQAGPRRAVEFTWERCAEGTMQALRTATTKRPAA